MKYLLVLMLIMSGCSMKKPITLDKTLKQTTTQDIDLYYEEKGEGEPIVLLHGFASSSYSFRYIIPELAKDHKVYAVDLKGFGKSPKPKDDRYSVYDQYLLVKRFIQKHHIKNPILIGHSLGGGVALLLTLDSEIKPKKLILIDAAAYKQRRPKLLRWAMIPFFGKVALYLLPSSYQAKSGYEYAFYDDKKIPKDGVKSVAKALGSRGGKYAFAKANEELIPDDIEEISSRYKEITTPTLIIWGDKDIVIRKSKAYRLHRDIKNSILKIIPNCGHIPQEEQPQLVLKYIREQI